MQDEKERLKAQLAANDATQGLQQLQGQVEQLQDQLGREQKRYALASKAAGEQVLPTLRATLIV